jgi:hypothetical protein
MMPKKQMRFHAGRIYRFKKGCEVVETGGQYRYLMPDLDDNGQFGIVDCWIVNGQGRRHPGYNASPVPVDVSSIGKEYSPVED